MPGTEGDSPSRSRGTARSGGTENLELASVESLRKAIEVSIRGILIVDRLGIVRYANEAAGELYGKEPGEFVGRPLQIPLETGDENVELEIVRADGTPRRAELSVVPIQWNDEPANLAFLEDVTERDLSQTALRRLNAQLSEANARLERLVQFDPLTDLLNRRGLSHALSKEVRWMRRHDASLLVLLLDLDDFKRINDTYGHAVGDIVLRETAHKLRAVLRCTDHAARIGGDEFMVLLPDTRPAEGLRVAEKIRLALAESPPIVQGKPLRVTASIGGAEVSGESPTVDEMLAKTHEALYASKRAGKNQVTMQQAGRQLPGADYRELGNAIRCLQEGTCLQPVAQPIVRLEDEEIVGFEFLTRSTIPIFERPTDFFRLCMDSNSLTRVDQRCFEACVAASVDVPRGLWRHLNLFPSTMIDVPTDELLADLPASQAKLYCIELSEQQIVGDPSYLCPPVDALKRAGMRIALDDVGFGRSCMESLILLEPDVVKVDRRCIQGLTRDPAQERSLERLLHLLRSLETEIVVEGIEGPQELEVLRDLGVGFAQGFLWGEPRELAAWSAPRRAADSRARQESGSNPPHSRGGF